MAGTRVLVTYGSRHVATAEIGELVADTLRDHGLRPDVRPCEEVGTVDGYDAVIVGGAVQAGRWHPAARRFTRAHRAALRKRAVWLFSSGPLDRSAETADIPPVAGAARALRRVRARGHVTFGGRLGHEAKGRIARWIVASGRGGDYRSAEHIRRWAAGVAVALLPATTTAGTIYGDEDVDAHLPGHGHPATRRPVPDLSTYPGAPAR